MKLVELANPVRPAYCAASKLGILNLKKLSKKE